MKGGLLAITPYRAYTFKNKSFDDQRGYERETMIMTVEPKRQKRPYSYYEKTINEYSYRSMERVRKTCPEKVEALLQKTKTKTVYSLFLPAQLSAPVISVDYSPCILPNMPQTGAITAQNQDFLSALHLFDHIFAHRQQKAAPQGISLRRGGLFPIMPSACSIAFLFERQLWYALAVYFLLLQRRRLCDTGIDFYRRLLPYLLRDMEVGVQRCGRRDMTQDGGQCLDAHLVGKGVPLRYNYDKPEKPRISRVFGYLTRIFILFQTEKSSREVSVS